MHFGSPLDPSQTIATEAKPRYVYLILKPHSQSFRWQVRLLLSEVKLSYVYLILKPHGQSSRGQVRPTERGEAKVRILDFKTTWSEFQRPSQTALAKAKPRCLYSILKTHGQSSRGQVRLLPPRRSRGAYTQF